MAYPGFETLAALKLAISLRASNCTSKGADVDILLAWALVVLAPSGSYHKFFGLVIKF
ncbi:MAG: hypothetical protein P3M75_00180 [Candidatus Hodgkinia cicadicola]|nr:MAG: hypothetical protein P3M75_00180 [Candidatus Hodgkinia cicadicola]